MGRHYEIQAGSGEIVCVEGRASMVHGRPGKNSMAELDDAGRITLRVTGSSPKNEEDGLEICARLVRVLNSEEGSWSVPVPGEQDIDGYSTNKTGDKLEMQVVRSSNNGRMWQELNYKGSVQIDMDVYRAADELIAAIRKKSQKYSSAQKTGITLVLDSGRTPGHTYQNVIDAFRKRHLADCQAAGFNAVWAVGSHEALVVRLDR
jgi:hypothetical protein